VEPDLQPVVSLVAKIDDNEDLVIETGTGFSRRIGFLLRQKEKGLLANSGEPPAMVGVRYAASGCLIISHFVVALPTKPASSHNVSECKLLITLADGASP
jgi:hypothetical protein